VSTFTLISFIHELFLIILLYLIIKINQSERQMKHPNVVRVLGLCIDGQEVNIVSELCHTDLNAILHGGMRGGKWQDAISLSTKERISMMIQISRGMLYLHKKERLIHRDLKPANVLLNNNFSIVQIGDFGISKVWEMR